MSETADINPGTRSVTDRRLAEIAGAVEQIAVATEPDFLLLSEDLRVLDLCARDLTRTTIRPGEMLQAALMQTRLNASGGVGKEALAELDGELGEVGRSIGGLSETLQLLYQLNQQGSQLMRVAAVVEVIGRAFAIESARSEKGREAFASFVEELRALGGNIGRVGQDIEREARESRKELAGMIQTIDSALGELRLLRRSAGRIVERNTARVARVFESSLAALDDADARAKSIADHTHSAMFHLQFGDILRQKLEHISEALLEAAASAESPAEKVSALEIQARQIESVRADLAQAQQNVKVSFSGITAETARLLESLGRMAKGEREQDSSSAIGELEAGLKSLIGLHGRGRDLFEKAGELSRTAAGLLARVSHHLAEIRPINAQMQLQALNATIKTRSLGREGAALASLTVEVSSVSKDSTQLVNNIVGVLTRLGQATAGADTSPAAEDGGQQAAIGEVLGHFSGLDQHLEAALAEAGALVKRQTERMADAEGRLAVLPAVAAKLEAVEQQLAAVQAGMGVSRAFAFTGVSERYTMESERATHRAAAAGTKIAATLAHEPDNNDNMEFF